MNIEEKVTSIIKDEIEKVNVTLKSVEYVNENGVNYLRIFIDKEPFVTIDDCVEVTNIINPLLDKHDVIEESYMLDISSIEKGGTKDE